MAIKKDRSDLPAAARPEGDSPVREPRYAGQLAEAWMVATDHHDNKPTAFDTRLRNSQAGNCTRAIQYDVLGVERTNPMSVADYWRMGLGTLVHERWQEVIKTLFPDSEAEMKVRWGDSSGHIDLVDGDTTVELKTCNGYGFKMAVGARGVAKGPKLGHKLQGALNAVGASSTKLVILYLSMENLSPRELEKLYGKGAPEWQRFAAEWHYTAEEFEPWAEAETKRMSRVLEYTDDGLLTPRFNPDMPKGARIVNPDTGLWHVVVEGQITQAGNAWNCGYCSYTTRCVADGPNGNISR